MPSPTARIAGYTQLLTALKAAPKAVDKAMRAEFRAVGQLVASEAEARFAELSEKTASGFRPFVRLRGVEVDQTLRRTTGLRPDWGRRQMSVGLYPAVDAKRDEILTGIAAAVEKSNEAVGLR